MEYSSELRTNGHTHQKLTQYNNYCCARCKVKAVNCLMTQNSQRSSYASCMCLHANMQQLHLHTFIKIYHDSLFTNTLLVIWFTYTHSPILCHSNNFPHTVSPLLCRYLLHYQLVRVHCILLMLLVRNILLLLFNLHTFNTVKFYRMSCTLNNENISTQKYANMQIWVLAIQYSHYNILQYYPYYSKPIISIIPISPLYTYINIHLQSAISQLLMYAVEYGGAMHIDYKEKRSLEELSTKKRRSY